MKPKSKKITVRLSKKMKQELHKAVKTSCYGIRGKSKWLESSIKTFIKSPYFISMVENGISELQADLTEVEAFYLMMETQNEIRMAIKAIRESNPFFEGVQSAILRSAVIYCLMMR
jgi:hypothetical protein